MLFWPVARQQKKGAAVVACFLPAIVAPIIKGSIMKLLSRRKAAAYLGCAPATLASYEAKGIAPRHFRVSGTSTIRYSVSDLDIWRVAHMNGGAA
jgi:hypothetical protein